MLSMKTNVMRQIPILIIVLIFISFYWLNRIQLNEIPVFIVIFHISVLLCYVFTLLTKRKIIYYIYVLVSCISLIVVLLIDFSFTTTINTPAIFDSTPVVWTLTTFYICTVILYLRRA